MSFGRGQCDSETVKFGAKKTSKSASGGRWSFVSRGGGGGGGGGGRHFLKYLISLRPPDYPRPLPRFRGGGWGRSFVKKFAKIELFRSAKLSGECWNMNENLIINFYWLNLNLDIFQNGLFINIQKISALSVCPAGDLGEWSAGRRGQGPRTGGREWAERFRGLESGKILAYPGRKRKKILSLKRFLWKIEI